MSVNVCGRNKNPAYKNARILFFQYAVYIYIYWNIDQYFIRQYRINDGGEINMGDMGTLPQCYLCTGDLVFCTPKRSGLILNFHPPTPRLVGEFVHLDLSKTEH